jgi:hypothetical protein
MIKLNNDINTFNLLYTAGGFRGQSWRISRHNPAIHLEYLFSNLGRTGVQDTLSGVRDTPNFPPLVKLQ